jgi:pyruvate ferredoxin oxidoreductase gamma subunit
MSNQIQDNSSFLSTEKEFKTIRLCGRGGQGIVTAGELIALAAYEEEKYAQAIPNFGAERRGGPAFCSLRISKTPILLKCNISAADAVCIFDPTIWHHRNMFGGLKDHGKLIFNTQKSGKDISQELQSGEYGYTIPVENYDIYTIDATTLALEILKRPIVNTAIIGAFSKATEFVSLDSINNVIEKRMKSNVEENRKLVSRAYDAVLEFRVKQ